MKTKSFILAIIAFFLLNMLTKSEISSMYSLQGSYNFPSGELGNSYNGGWGVLGSGEFYLLESMPELGFLASAGFTSFALKGADDDVYGSTPKATLETFSLKVGALYYFWNPSILEFYGGIEFGVNLMKGVSYYQGTAFSSTNESTPYFGLAPILGVNIPFNATYGANISTRFNYIGSEHISTNHVGLYIGISYMM